MKSNSKKIIISSICLAMSLSAVLGIFIANSNGNILKTGAGFKEYAVTLDSSNAQAASGDVTKLTKLGNSVDFRYQNVEGVENYHTKLNKNGTIVNIDQITSIVSFTAVFSGVLEYRTSLDNNSWSEYSLLESGVSVDTNDQPYYLEIKAPEDGGCLLESAKYVYTCYARGDIVTVKNNAINDVQEAFNNMDIDDYSKIRWGKIVDKLNESISSIEDASTASEVTNIKNDALDYFANSPKASEFLVGTLFDYTSADSNYEYDLDDEGHIVIYYDGYPGYWKHTGTKSNLHTNIAENNQFSLTFRNDIAEEIEVCMQLTDDSGAYKADTGIVKVSANETKTLTLQYQVNVTKLYFFVDSCSVHERKGQVTILGHEFSYEEIEGVVYDPKLVDINQPMVLSEETVLNKYVLQENDHALSIGRVDAVIRVTYHGNDSGHKWFGLHLYAGSNKISVSDSAGHTQEGEDNALVRFSLPIEEGKKLLTNNIIYMDISYQAENLTFEVLSYEFFYTAWKATVTETVNVNTAIYVDGSGKDVNDNYYTASIPYSSFTKKGRVSKVEVTFTTINEASYGKSQVYFTGLRFTKFPSGNNNVLNIGPIMDKSSSVEKQGTMTIYPTENIDLTQDSSIDIVCWWASATYIRVDSITLYTDDVEPPSDVTNAVAHPVDSGLVLTWSSVARATSYVIYEGANIIKETASTYVVLDGLNNNQEYTYKISAKNYSGESAGVNVSGTPTEGAQYDTFIEALNTPLEVKIGEEGIASIFSASSTYFDFGNNARLKSVINKMQNSQETKIAYFGGSITVGETATLKDEHNHAKGYAYYSYQWLKSNYDVGDKSVFLNESICGTGSEDGIVRAQKDLLDHNPDLIFIEFAANNGSTALYKETYESLIRKCLRQENAPAVVLVFSATSYTGSTEVYMSDIGKYYSLPMFTMDKGLKAVCSTLDKGRTDPIFHDFSSDATHPTDDGHKLMAKSLCYFLRNMINKDTDDAIEVPVAPSKSGYDKFDNFVSFDSTNANGRITSLGSFAAANTGTTSTRDQSDVTAFQSGWKKSATSGNDPMVIEVTAKNFMLVYEAGNPSVSGDPTGNIIVTYTNKNDNTDTGSLTWDVSKDAKQKTSGSTAITDQSSKGWENPVGILLFDKATADDYEITIQMAEDDGICVIMRFGYSY